MVPARKALWLVLVGAASALLLMSGCGADEPDPGEDPAAEAPERPAAPPDADPDGERSEEVEGAARRVVDACREVVERAPGVPEETKRDLIADCEAAARGDEEARRKAASAACDVVAAATAPPLLRGQVADACKRAISGAALRA